MAIYKTYYQPVKNKKLIEPLGLKVYAVKDSACEDKFVGFVYAYDKHSARYKCAELKSSYSIIGVGFHCNIIVGL